MSTDSIESKMKEIVADQLGLAPEDITAQSSFTKDLGADDLDFLELVMAFEEEFGVDIDEETAEKIETVEDAVNVIGCRSN